MEARMLKTAQATYEAAPWTGENTSGRRPFGDYVLILPDVAAEKTGSILIPDSVKSRQTMAAETGIIAAIGDGSWKWTADRTRPFEGYAPKVGDRVDFERYAGQEILGADGQLYRMMTDKCVISVLDA